MISEVRIENFKRFQNQTFTFKPQGVTFLAGGNNSGKSTLLHALAVWDFCRTVIEQAKGMEALQSGAKVSGIGVSAEDFSPLALPSLRHLWHNLQPHGSGNAPSYNLKIRCSWPQSVTAPGATPALFSLEFALLLSGDRLYIKPSDSNLARDATVPRVAYLPTFAGIAPVEERLSPAMRKRLIGRGIAGAVLRNMLYDLWRQNQEERETLKSLSGRISARDLADFRRRDPWERLLETVQDIFKLGLSVEEFNEALHTRLRVELYEGRLENKRFTKTKGIAARDVMVEGSGFLQWLSVYALAVRDDLQVLLLDEPDAHLHPSLQGELTFKLAQLAVQRQKQVLLATHSTTILGEAKFENIFRMERTAYLPHEEDRPGLFWGLGTLYAPLVDRLKKHKKLFLYEGPSDIILLKLWTGKLGLTWPENIVCKESTQTEEHRVLFVKTLQDEISGLKMLSLQDRDDKKLSDINQELIFSSRPDKSGMKFRYWRRRNIENYLLVPRALAAATGKTEAEVIQFLQDNHAIAVPANPLVWNCPPAFCLSDGKRVIGQVITDPTATNRYPNSFGSDFGVDYSQIAAQMRPDEIADDVKTLIRQIQEFSRL